MTTTDSNSKRMSETDKHLQSQVPDTPPLYSIHPLDIKEQKANLNEEKVDTSDNTNDDDDKKDSKFLIYGVTDIPPWYSIIPLALQITVVGVFGTVSVAFLIHNKVCGEGDNLFYAELISTSVVMCGICTILEVCVGIRLPVVQGGSASYIAPIVAMMSLPKWQCPNPDNPNYINATLSNVTTNRYTQEALWKPRLQEINGALILAALVHTTIGATGLMGYLMRHIGPLTITPTISLIGLGLVPAIIKSCEHSWPVALITAATLIISALYLGNVPLCFPYYKNKEWNYAKAYIFRMIPILLAIGVGWLISYILTATGSLPKDPTKLGYNARTDIKTEVINRAEWVFLPYPGQWGAPTFSAAVFMGMLSSTLSSLIESIGIFSATSKLCGLPEPPAHAVNRGLTVGGFGNILCGLMGSGHATTSYGSAVGIIGVSKVGSRSVWYIAAVFMLLFGIFGKFGAFLASIPDPVNGGCLAVGMSMVTAVGLSKLKNCNLQSTRNLLIVGFSIIMGLVIPTWIKANPGAIKSGSKEADQVISIFLSTPMIIGGLLGFIMDNTVPGTREERGFIDNPCEESDIEAVTDSEEKNNTKDNDSTIYDLPYVMKYLRQIKCCFYNPTSPTFNSKLLRCARCSCTSCKREKEISNQNTIQYTNQTLNISDEHTITSTRF